MSESLRTIGYNALRRRGIFQNDGRPGGPFLPEIQQNMGKMPHATEVIVSVPVFWILRGSPGRLRGHGTRSPRGAGRDRVEEAGP